MICTMTSKTVNVTPKVRYTKEPKINHVPKNTKSPGPKKEISPYLLNAERVNGRAAMIGFSSAVIDELVNHQPLMEQFKDNLGLITAISGLVVVGTASNPKDEGYIWGIFDPIAEKLNGRAAMIGILALLLTEGVSSPTPLF